MLCLNLTAAISQIFFDTHVKLNDAVIACGIPVSVLSTSLFSCHCSMFLSATPASCESVKYLHPLAMKQEPPSCLAKSTIPQEYRGAQKAISMTWQDVNFDISFTISLHFLPSVSK